MKRLLVITALSMTVLAGCGNQGGNAEEQFIPSTEVNSEVETEEVVEETLEEVEKEAEIVIVDQAIVDKLKEKFSYSNSYEIITESETIVKLSLPQGYTFNVTNTIEENIETVATIKSPEINGYIYNIKMYEIPVENKDFLVKNPLKISETKNQAYNNMIELINIDNKEIELDNKVYDNTGLDHKTFKYEIYTDLSILQEEGLGVHREPPTYFVVEKDSKLIAFLISEEKVNTPETATAETTGVTESEATVDENTTVDVEETAEIEENTSVSENSLDTPIIIEDTEKTEEDTHDAEVAALYESLDEETKKCINTFKTKFLEQGKEVITEGIADREESIKRIDNIGNDILNNLMIGRFD